MNDLEKSKQKELDNLLNAWKKQISGKPKIEFEDGKKYSTETYFCKDGFFPGYFDAKPKVLFVGRETRNMSGGNYVDKAMQYFKDGGNNGVNWWKRLLYIAYGIQHEGNVKFDDLPVADDIAKEMLDSKKFNFAVMNISKYSNDRDDGANMDSELVDRFLSDSELNKRNFFQEELKLLDPDIIITANLWGADISNEYLDLCFPDENFSENLTPKSKKYAGKICHFKYNLFGREVDFLDIYHLSARYKKDYEDFYRPVMDILFPQK